MYYNPANDPEVINGIQEAYGFKIGDAVEFTNSNGISFSPHKVIGFVQKPDPKFRPNATIYLDLNCYWYPVRPDQVRKIV